MRPRHPDRRRRRRQGAAHEPVHRFSRYRVRPPARLASRPRTSKRPGPSRQEALPAHHPGTSQRPGHGLAAHRRGPGGPDHRGPAGLLGHLAAPARPAPGRDRQRHHHLVRPLRRHPPAPPGPGRRRPPGRAPLRPQPRHRRRAHRHHHGPAGGGAHRGGYRHGPGRCRRRGHHRAVPQGHRPAPGLPGPPLRRRPGPAGHRCAPGLPHLLVQRPRALRPGRRLLPGPHDHHAAGLRGHHGPGHAHGPVAHDAAHSHGAGRAALDHSRPALSRGRHRAGGRLRAVAAPGGSGHPGLPRRRLRSPRARLPHRPPGPADLLRHGLRHGLGGLVRRLRRRSRGSHVAGRRRRRCP